MWNSAPANPYTTVYPGGYVQPQSYIGMPSAQTLPHQMPPQMSQQMSQPSGQEDLFLIVNPSSGGNKGQDFMKVPQPFIMDVDGVQVNLHIHSIKEEKSREAGFAALKQALYYRPGGVRVVVGGGDGTVMWVDSEMEKHGIDSARQVIYGIVPLGTGNDFARSYGWGGKNPSGITENDCAVLRDLVRAWVRAKPVRHDVWEVEVNVHQPEDGDTDEEDGGPRRGKVLKVEEGENGREEKEQVPHIKKPLVNYFSIGQESRMGIDFDKNRTKSQSANLCVYGIMSLKTECSCFQKWSHIGSVVGSLDRCDGALLRFGGNSYYTQAGNATVKCGGRLVPLDQLPVGLETGSSSNTLPGALAIVAWARTVLGAAPPTQSQARGPGRSPPQLFV